MTFKVKYLKILGLNERKPSLEFLNSLIAEQLRCFPYENISKIVMLDTREQRMPTADEYLDDQITYGYGGTCYPQNIYFSRLLHELGFNCSLIQASVNETPGAHIFIKVCLNALTYYVDFGFLDAFTGPFLESMPVQKTIIGRVFKFIPADKDNKLSFEIWKNDELIMKFLEESELSSLIDFETHIKDSFSSDKYFMNNLVIGRRWGDPSYNFVNNKALYFNGSNVQRIELNNIDEVEAFIHDEMDLPRYQVRKAYDYVNSKRQ